MADGTTVINLCSTVTNDTIHQMHPTTRVIKAFPVPPVAHHRGITVVYPPNKQIREFFETMGQVVEADSLEKCQAMMCVTGIMGPFY